MVWATACVVYGSAVDFWFLFVVIWAVLQNPFTRSHLQAIMLSIVSLCIALLASSPYVHSRSTHGCLPRWLTRAKCMTNNACEGNDKAYGSICCPVSRHLIAESICWHPLGPINTIYLLTSSVYQAHRCVWEAFALSNQHLLWHIFTDLVIQYVSICESNIQSLWWYSWSNTGHS